jgi:ribosomal protein L11
MKKVGIDMMLGRNTRCHYKKRIPRTVILKATLPAGEATKAPPFGSTLGLNGVKADEFCSFFNKDSIKFWAKGVRINVIILISPSRSYIVEYKLPKVLFLLDQYFKVNNKNKSLLFSKTFKEGRKKLVTEEVKSPWDLLQEKKIKKREIKKPLKLKEFLNLKKDNDDVISDLLLFWRGIYQIAIIKSQQTNPVILKQWIMQIMGTFNSCHYENPYRRAKQNFNWRKRKRKKW